MEPKRDSPKNMKVICFCVSTGLPTGSLVWVSSAWVEKDQIVVLLQNSVQALGLVVGHCWLTYLWSEMVYGLCCRGKPEGKPNRRRKGCLLCSGGRCAFCWQGDSVRSTTTGLAAVVSLLLLALLWHTHWQEVETSDFLESLDFLSDWLLPSTGFSPSRALAAITIKT